MISRATNEDVCSVLIVILPRNTAISQSKIVAELEKFVKVDKVRIWSALDPLLVLVEFKNEEMARNMVSATNGSITVDGQKWTISTVKDCDAKLKIVEGRSPLRLSSRPPAVNIDSLWGVYRNYLDAMMTDQLQDTVSVNENVTQKSTTIGRPIIEYRWIDKVEDSIKTDEDTDSVASYRTDSEPHSTKGNYGSVRSCPTSIHSSQSFVLINETPPTFTWLPIDETSRTPWVTVDPLQNVLPPPYHNLPNTPFFRNAKIVPPPVFDNEGLPTLQRITNRYMASMKIQDELDKVVLVKWAETEMNKLLTGFNHLPAKTKKPFVVDESKWNNAKNGSLWSEMEIIREKNEKRWSPWTSPNLVGESIIKKE